MALIQCPECGKEISDKVTACPHCGYPMVEPSPQPEAPQQVEVTAINLSAKDPNKAKKIIPGVVFVLCTVLAIVVGIYLSKTKAAKDARNTYIDNLTSIRETAMTGAITSEEVCILTHDVWYNTIFEERDFDTNPYTQDASGSFNEDFNDSIKALYADEDIKSKLSDIQSNRALVDAYMKRLQNPTEEFEDCYDTLDTMYDAYCGLTDLAASPSGSLTSYTESYRTYDTDFAQAWEKLATQIPEK